MSEGREGRIEAQAREMFEDRVARIDGRTLARLNQARHAALAEARGRRSAPWRSWVPAGAVAAAAVLAVALWAGRVGSPDHPAAPASSDALELVLVQDDLEMMGEDPVFYDWAAVAADGETRS
jgi:anti-sigma-K factor RskA